MNVIYISLIIILFAIVSMIYIDHLTEMKEEKFEIPINDETKIHYKSLFTNNFQIDDNDRGYNYYEGYYNEAPENVGFLDRTPTNYPKGVVFGKIQN